jgi:hypothetical protein
MAYIAEFDEYRTFGVEVECFGAPNVRVLRLMNKAGLDCVVIDHTNRVLDTWRISKDTSIQGESAMEIVSPVLCGREGLIQVAKVLEILQTAGCQVNFSCGFHVHWFCGDYTGKNMLSLLRQYAKFERVIDSLVSPSRRENRNKSCRSLVKDDTLQWITDLDPQERLRATQIASVFESRWFEVYQTVHGQERRSSRYHKINLQSYPMYGTIEFRHHQGTLNVAKAINWIVFTQQFINKAKRVSVSREPASKLTLSGLMRSLKISEESQDARISALAVYLKERQEELEAEETSAFFRLNIADATEEVIREGALGI